MEKKKIAIVGAGIAGLCAGVYAARSGFDVTIYEQHIIAGGLSTSWSRKGYYFEGGMHWLTGSDPKQPLNKVWKETGALKDNNPIENRDPTAVLIAGNQKIQQLRDLKKFSAELLKAAPEDAKAIKRLCKDIKTLEPVHQVLNDIIGLKAKNPQHPGFAEVMKMIPVLFSYKRLVNQSYHEYTGKFKNENVRHLLNSMIGDRYNAMSFIYTLASFASGDCGYPAGGSVRMANNMLDTYKALGGKIEFRSKVENIELDENNKATGIKVKGQIIPCDAVIVTQDMRNSIDVLFDKMIDDPLAHKIRRNVVAEQCVFMGFGIKADLSHLPQAVVFPLDEPFEVAGNKYNELKIYNYAKYKDHAPEGCSTITTIFLGDSYNYWKQAKADGTYKAKKDELAKRFIEAISKFIPEIRDNVEVYDVATPCTYERYCSTYQGSWMSVWQPGTKKYNYPQKLKTVKGVYFAGQRTFMPGGLPMVVYSGRIAVQLLCRDTKTMFV